MNVVDVVIPCHNYARFLRQCVTSVLSQEGVRVRVLILDDCSTDDTEAVGRTLSRDERVEFRRHEANSGHIATFNEGILGWAASKYSLLLSADDALAPGALARATDLMERHPELGMVYGMAYGIGTWGLPTCAPSDFSDEYRIIGSEDFLEYCFTNGNAIATPTAVVKTELQQRLGGYRHDMPHSGDMEMWMRFAVHAPIGVLKSVQGFYRRHDGNMSLDYYNNIIRDDHEVLHTCEHIFCKWGHLFKDAQQWRMQARKRMSEKACWVAYHALDKCDMQKYTTCVNFAVSIYPEIRKTYSWWRLHAKLFLGPHFYHLLTSTKSILFPFRANSEEERKHPGWREVYGWWPEKGI